MCVSCFYSDVVAFVGTHRNLWRPTVTTAFSTNLVILPLPAAGQISPVPAATKSVSEQMVETLTKLACGPHAGYRANHAKGLVVKETFAPSAAATSLSIAAHLQKTVVPVTVRFSSQTGVLTMPDRDTDSKHCGIAVRFSWPDTSFTDIVSLSYNGFPAATPKEF